jgi:hypothetical protein
MGKKKRTAKKKRREALKRLMHSSEISVPPSGIETERRTDSDLNDNPLIPLAQALSKFDPADLLTAVAGLQLMPENAERTIRLEALAHTVASLKGDNTNLPVGSDLLDTICNSWPLNESAIASAEDPFENLLT